MDAEEGDEAKVPTAGIKPSPEEIDRHNARHIPFRNWCPYCVAGKAKDNPHKVSETSANGVNLFTIDYMFLYDREDDKGGVLEDVQEEVPEDGDADDEGDDVGLSDNRSMPVLVLRDRRTWYVTARVAPRKGAHPYTVRRLGQDITQILGYQE